MASAAVLCKDGMAGRNRSAVCQLRQLRHPIGGLSAVVRLIR
jgi:hypothetical protein